MLFSPFKLPFKSPIKLASVCGMFIGLTLFLSACEEGLGLDDGNGVESIRVAAFAGKTSMRRDDCNGTVLFTDLTFTNGNVTSSTFRADYTSLNPDIAEVDSSGRVLPVAPGTATIVASYLSHTDTIDIEVTNVFLPENNDQGQGLFLFPPAATNAPNLSQTYQLYGVLSDNSVIGFTIGASTRQANLTVANTENAPEEEQERVDATFQILDEDIGDDQPDGGVGPDGEPARLYVEASVCGYSGFPERTATATLDVKTIASIELLQLTPDNDNDTTTSDSIPFGSAAAYAVKANFAGSDQTNIITTSSSATIESSDTFPTSYAGLSNFFNTIRLVTIDVPPSGVTLDVTAEVTSPSDNTTPIESNSFPVVIDDADYLDLDLFIEPNTSNLDNFTMLAGTVANTRSVAEFSTGNQDVSLFADLSFTDNNAGLFVANTNNARSFIFAPPSATGSSVLTSAFTPTTNVTHSDNITISVVAPSEAVFAANALVIEAGSCQTGNCRASVTYSTSAGTFIQDVTKSVAWISSNSCYAIVSGALDNAGEVAFGADNACDDNTINSSEITASLVIDDVSVTSQPTTIMAPTP